MRAVNGSCEWQEHALGAIDALKSLLVNREIDADLRDAKGNTLLLVACQNGHKRIVKLVLREGADVNATNFQGNTALHYAARMGFIECVKALIANNANKRQQNKLKQVPADLALTPEIEELL